MWWRKRERSGLKFPIRGACSVIVLGDEPVPLTCDHVLAVLPASHPTFLLHAMADTEPFPSVELVETNTVPPTPPTPQEPPMDALSSLGQAFTPIDDDDHMPT